MTTPAAAAEAAREVWVVDLEGKDREEKLAVLALQGIVNRDGARVFAVLGKDNHWVGWHADSGRSNGVGPIWDEAAVRDLQTRHASAESVWMEILRGDGLRFTKVEAVDLLRATRGKWWKGWLVYQEFATDLAPAATWAGLDDLVPVTAGLLEKWRQAGIEAPVTADYRAVRKDFAPGADARLAGHRWMLEKLAPRCRKDGAVSRDRTYGLDSHDTMIDIDLATRQRWMVYDLNHVALANKAAGISLASDPPDRIILDELLGNLERFSFVYGWGKGGEESFVRSLNRHGMLAEVSGVPNNSFFVALPAARPPYRQKARPAPGPADESKVHLAFLVNEGDSIKAASTFMLFGAWLQPERGKVPINWGINPNLLHSHPRVMKHYYDTMTENDFFFAPASGWGYAHPAFLPADALSPYAAAVRKGMSMADLKHLNVWYLNSLNQDGRRMPFLRETGVAGHVEWTGDRQAVEFPEGGPVNICSNHFYTYKEPAVDFARRLIAETNEIKPPWFIAIYGANEHGTPHRFLELARQLPPDRFKITRLDEFFDAAAALRDKLHGRIWKPGPGAPKGTAP